MKKVLFLGLIALGFAASQARADVSFGIRFGGHHHVPAPPVVYREHVAVAPAPVYVEPVYRHAPVYAPAAPVCAPAPVIVERRSPSVIIGFGGHHGSHHGYYRHGGHHWGHGRHHGSHWGHHSGHHGRHGGWR